MNQPAWGRRKQFRPPSTRRLWMRRILFTAATATLLAVLCYVTFQPLWHPRTHLVLLTGDVAAAGPDVTAVPAADYVVDDLSAFFALTPTLVHDFTSSGPRLSGALRSREQLQQLGTELTKIPAGSRDVLMIYAAAQCVSDEGDAWLLCSSVDPQNPFLGRCRLRNLLSQLTESEAGVKVLLLDAGRTNYDPARGMMENDFPRLLEREVRRTKDPSLWVLASHSAGERSHLAHTLRRSVFGFFTARGLRGAADANGNAEVDLNELSGFVAGGAAEWVQRISGGQLTQTPQLLWGGGKRGTRAASIVLAAVVPPTDDEPPATDVRAAIREEQARSKAADAASQRGYGELNAFINQQIGAAAPQNLVGQFFKDAARRNIGGEASPTAAGGEKKPDEAVPKPDDAAPAAEDKTTATVAAAADGEAATDEAAASDAEIPAVQASDAPALLIENWRLCRDLCDRQRKSWQPLDYAPHLWRAMELEILAHERRLRTGGSHETQSSAERLAAIKRELTLLKSGAPPKDFPRGSLAQRIAEARPARQLPSFMPQSYAATCLVEKLGGAAPPEALVKKISALDEITTSGGPAALEKWAGKLEPDDDRWTELRFARRAAGLTEIDWRTIQAAIRTVLAAEQASAVSLEGATWVKDAVQRGDQRRLLAEHALFTAPKPDREKVVSDLNAAREEYDAAIRDATLVTEARRLVNNVLHDAPYIVQWSAGGGPTALSDVTAWLEGAAGLARLVEEASPEKLPELRQMMTKVRRQTDEMQSAFDDDALERLIVGPRRAGDAWRIDLLLETPLVTGAVRARLLDAVGPLEEFAVGDLMLDAVAPLEPGPSTVAGERDPRSLTAAQIALARLAASPLVKELGAEMLATAAENVDQLKPPAADDDSTQSGAKWSVALQDFRRNLGRRLERAQEDALDLSAPSERPARMRVLRALEHSLHLVDPRLARTLSPETPLYYLTQARAYDWLLWDRSRRLAAAEEAAPDEQLRLRQTASAYRAAAGAIPRQPLIPRDLVTPLELACGSTVSLSYDAQQTLTVQLVHHGVRDTDAWLVLQYDAALVKPSTDSETPFYDPRQLGLGDDPGLLSLAQVSTRLTKVPATLRLRPGVPTTMTLKLSREHPAPRPTRLLVQAFTADHTARRTVEIDLPAPDPYQLVLQGTAGTWSPDESGLTLHPFPNRSTNFKFAISGSAEESRKVLVQLFALPITPAGQLPRAALSALDSERLKDAILPGELLALAEVELPAAGKTVPLILLPPPAVVPPPPVPGTPPAPPAESLLPRIEHGLLLVITDVEKKQSVFRRLDIAPQRPQRFVRPRVGYNPAKQRVEVQVTPQDIRFLPPGPVDVHLESIERLPPDAERRMDGQLKSPEFMTELHFEVPEGEGRIAALHLNIDGYPRAFTYRVPCDRRSIDIAPDLDFVNVRITDLTKGTIFTAPVGTIPIKLAIDAPAASFRNPPLLVEVGVDRNRDRELTNDNTLKLTQERQVEVRLEKIVPGDGLTLETKVDDFELKLPDSGLDSTRANVLARVSLGEMTAWSAPVEVVLDRDPPRVTELAVNGPNVVQGESAELTLTAADAELSGIAAVEGMFDRARSGTIPEGAPTIAGSLQEDGRWLVKLPTDGMSAGAYNALVRAVDRAGNKSEPARVKVQVVSEAAVNAEKNKLVLSDIEGTVVYGTQPQVGLKVTLGQPSPPKGTKAPEPPAGTPKFAPTITDAQGKFKFKKVPPGEYAVKADGLIHNRNRKIEVPVKTPLAKDAKPLELKFK